MKTERASEHQMTQYSDFKWLKQTPLIGVEVYQWKKKKRCWKSLIPENKAETDFF